MEPAQEQSVSYPSQTRQEPHGETFEKPTLASGSKTVPLLVLGALLVVTAGTATGYLLAGSTEAQPGEATKSSNVSSTPITRPKSAEEDIAFKDCTEGKLEPNKEDAVKVDGTHRLTTDDPQKPAYLTSSVVDLSFYEGKTVTVWGESHASKKVGWLMDVGRIKKETGVCTK